MDCLNMRVKAHRWKHGGKSSQFANGILDVTLKACATKGKINKLDLIKTLLCLKRHITKKMQRQPIEWKISETYVSDEDWVSNT